MTMTSNAISTITPPAVLMEDKMFVQPRMLNPSLQEYNDKFGVLVMRLGLGVTVSK